MVAMQLLHGSSASLDGGVSGRTRPKGAAQLYPKGLVDFPPGAASRLSSVLQTASLIFGRRRYLSAHSSIWRQAAIYNTIYSTSASSEASFTETVLWSGLATLARWRTRTTPTCPAQSVGQQERQKPMTRRTHASASAKKPRRHPHAGRLSTSPSSANGRGRRRRCRRRHQRRHREHRRARALTWAAYGRYRRGRAP